MNTTCPNQEAAEELLADTVYGLIREGKALGSFVERAGVSRTHSSPRAAMPLSAACVPRSAQHSLLALGYG